MFKVPEKFRLREGAFGSDESFGNNGAFFIPFKPKRSSKQKSGQKPTKAILKVICSDGMSWEHVSVSLPSRDPTHRMMCFVKDLFWDDTDVVIQIHPPKDDYINNHGHCLHLWRPIDTEIPLPPSIMVGVKDVGLLTGEA